MVFGFLRGEEGVLGGGIRVGGVGVGVGRGKFALMGRMGIGQRS